MTVRTSLQRSLGARRARGADGNRRPQTSEHALLVHALSDEVDVFGITPAGEQRVGAVQVLLRGDTVGDVRAAARRAGVCCYGAVRLKTQLPADSDAYEE